ncbi:hypothetical protein [Haloferula sp. BvORR071]|uniref:hypothetical protein n=1 Tax=Haloferula sp. BvORR071 TaxID=1396141 RepID=UPI002240F148|nr:hypothetical protein [Haloferula sp. BvORR071]
MRVLVIPVCALSLFLNSCSLFKDEEPKEKPKSAHPVLVGRVASTPPGADFVLIETYGAWKVPDGGLLSGIGNEGRTSNLAATGEKLGQYLAADVRSGVAKVGDSVYYRPIAEPEEGPALSAPAAEGHPSSQLETQKDSSAEPAKP